MARRLSTLASDEARLAVVIADRIMQVLDSNPNFRTNYGRIDDFSRLLNISRSSAARILRGEAVPQTVLLVAMAQKLEVTLEWLTGQTNEDFARQSKRRPIHVTYWSPRPPEVGPPPALTFPAGQAPPQVRTDQLIAITWPDHGLQGYAGPGDTVLVESRTDLLGGAIHAILWRDGRLEAAHVARFGASDRFAVRSMNGRFEEIPAAEVAFGVPQEPCDGAPFRDQGGPTVALSGLPVPPSASFHPALRVLGLIVGRMSFNALGLQQIEGIG